MKNTWQRLESWYESNAPDVERDLLPGASAKDFASLEKLIGAKLPETFKQVYAIHNGQMGVGPPALVDWWLLSIKGIQKQWKLMKGLFDRGALNTTATAVGPVRPVWWDAKWVPIGYSGGGDFQCLDLAPPPGGKIGQIVTFIHTDGMRERAAESLPSWMEAYATDFENGLYRLEDGALTRIRSR